MLRVLFCSEREGDWAVVQACLYGVGSMSPYFHLLWVKTIEGARAAILEGNGDVYIVDESLCGGQGFELLSLDPPTGHPSPILLLSSGSGLSEEAMAIRAGASDVINRDEMSPRGLRRAIIHASARASMTSRMTDGPSGLISALTLRHRLELALSRERLSRAGVALLAISVAGFPGEVGSDRVATAIAERIQNCVREIDSVCKVGPSRFLLLLEGLFHGAHADILADRLLAELQAPLSLHGVEFKPAVSLGIGVAPDDGGTAGELQQSAEMALAQAEAEGGRVSRFRSAPLNEKARRRWLLQKALEGALERNEFQLYFQPQVSLRAEHVIGAEALLRWQSPHLGWVSPAEFVPILEATDQIQAVGLWILEVACKQARAWELAGTGVKISVNASAKQLASPGFGDHVERVLAQTGLSPRLLGLEITEGLLLESSQAVRDLLTQLRKRGIWVSVDDFGTGYASLSYVKRFAMDVIKIDREFIRGIPLDVENAAITSAILALGNSLGLKVIAEGVENEAELEFLRSLGCEAAQGFYYAKPMPPAEFEVWSAKWQPEPDASPRSTKR